jgi:hypothetical protein
MALGSAPWLPLIWVVPALPLGGVEKQRKHKLSTILFRKVTRSGSGPQRQELCVYGMAASVNAAASSKKLFWSLQDVDVEGKIDLPLPLGPEGLQHGKLHNGMT